MDCRATFNHFCRRDVACRSCMRTDRDLGSDVADVYTAGGRRDMTDNDLNPLATYKIMPLLKEKLQTSPKK